MGYATTIPSGLSGTVQSASVTDVVVVTTLSADYGLGTIATPNYKNPLSHAYAKLVIFGLKDTSGAENELRTTNIPYLQLDDGVTTKNAGNLPWDYIGKIAANGIQPTMLVIPFTTDLVSYLKPSTTYTVTIRRLSCTGNNLRLFQPHVEIDLFFNV